MVRYKTEPGEKGAENPRRNFAQHAEQSEKAQGDFCSFGGSLCHICGVRRGCSRAVLAATGSCCSALQCFFLLIILFSQKVSAQCNAKAHEKKRNNAVLGGTFEYVIDDDGVAITSPLGTGKNNWSAFDRWGEQDGYIYLVRLDNNVVLMDKSRLTPDELKELERLLENVKK